MIVIHSNFVHTPSFGQLEILKDSYIGVQDGVIQFIEKEMSESRLKCYGIHKNDIIQHYSPNNTKFIVPGFIDLHVHSAQYAFCGTGTSIKLMEWLHEYAFPAELKVNRDPKYTESLYKKLVSRLISNGITTAQYFGTIDRVSCLKLAEIIDRLGARGLVGKVNQDQHSPDPYCEDTTKSLAETDQFIRDILSMNSDRIRPVITPRFIPNCSKTLMDGLGKLYQKYNKMDGVGRRVHIQSHISESLDEIEFVHQLHPNQSDTDIFDRAGLLTDRTVMAHAVHCDDLNWKVLSSKGVGIAHCPLSNAFFAHGSLDVVRLMKMFDLKVGLGTDIAGGYSYSMLQCMRQSVITNRILHKEKEDKYMNYKHSLYLATVGGARCLGMEREIGMFRVGYQFDAVMMDTVTKCRNIDLFERDTVDTIFEKLMNLGDDRNISAVWVDGKEIHRIKTTNSKL